MLNYILIMISPVAVEFLMILFGKRIVIDDKVMRKAYAIIIGAVILIALGFKSVNVGSGDVSYYVGNWNLMRTLSLDQLFKVINTIDIERGYLISVWALSHIFQLSQFLFILYGALVSLAVARFMYLNVRDMCMGFTMFFSLGWFALMVQGLRQGIAISICLFALERCKKRKPISFFLLVALAMTFHASAFVFALVFIFAFLKKNVISISVYSVICIAIMYLVNWLVDIGNFVINDHYAVNKDLETGGGFISLLIFVIVLAAYFFTTYFIPDDDREHTIFLCMTILGMIVFAMRFFVAGIMQRVTFYFVCGQYVLMSAVTERLAFNQRVALRYLVIALCLGIALYKASYSKIVPYSFIWN